jgi:phosphocarrier protein
MIERTVEVLNRAGIHTRPAAVIVRAICQLKSEITFAVESNVINAKSILSVITLGATYGTKIKITCSGDDEDTAMDILMKLFENKFEEP